jgi:hypothetical protein
MKAEKLATFLHFLVEEVDEFAFNLKQPNFNFFWQLERWMLLPLLQLVLHQLFIHSILKKGGLRKNLDHLL